MIIIAGWLGGDAADRDRYLASVAEVARQARVTEGCLDFTQAADPLDPGRIKRWESDADLAAFRTSGRPGEEEPEAPLRAANVRKYWISAVEEA